MLAHEPFRLPPHIEDELFALEECLPENRLPHLMRVRGHMLAQQRELEQARHEIALVEAGRMVHPVQTIRNSSD